MNFIKARLARKPQKQVSIRIRANQDLPPSNNNHLYEEEEDKDEAEVQYDFFEVDVTDYGIDPKDVNTPDQWIKRHPELVRLTGKHPLNCQPPLSKLVEHGFITPVPLHYVRNHGAVPKCNWDDWRVEVEGLVRRPTTFSMEDLFSMPSRTFPITITCSGNRRKEVSMVKQTAGFHWSNAATSTSIWKGVKLRDVLLKCGIMPRSKGAHHIWFDGGDSLPAAGGTKYSTSIRRDVAMDDSHDILLAYEQNGKRLEPDHGFPVRLIVPGYTGGRMVKWLRKIIVTDQESDNYYHYNDNRVLPSHVDAQSAASEGWIFKSEYVINEMNINSTITTPLHGEMIPVSSEPATQKYKLGGYAYSGGGRKVTRVEVSFNNGETWKVCKLVHTEKPNKYGKYWCWCFWSYEVDVASLSQAKFFAVRAWDCGMNTQPQNFSWNLMGMMNNSWYKVKVIPFQISSGAKGLTFEHPVNPGNDNGGWMTMSAEEENKTFVRLKSRAASFKLKDRKIISMTEVKKHNDENSAWIVVDGKVYDCTPYLKDHPGGAESILINAGTDSSEEFDAIHSDKAKDILENYYIGDLENADITPVFKRSVSVLDSIIDKSTRPVALDPTRRIPFKLIEKENLTHNTRRFRFALQTPTTMLGLPVGKHMFFSAVINGKLVMRAYTPTTSNDDLGYFDQVVKIYFKDVVPQYPLGGLMSQHLESLEIGDTIDVKGPLGHIEYTGKGNFLVNGKPKFGKRLAMITGGTGITPIYQVIQAIIKDKDDKTEVFLVFCNRSEDDLLFQAELEDWNRYYPNVHIWFNIDRKNRQDSPWNYSVGRMNGDLLQEKLPPGGDESLALLCGPPNLLDFLCVPTLAKMGYTAEDILTF